MSALSRRHGRLIRPTPRDATFAGLGALTFPVCLHLTMRLLGRHELDPDHRASDHGTRARTTRS